ncbi:MAG: hypothetical protein ABIZ91_18185 [Gemmatimonadaceae bacterium]
MSAHHEQPAPDRNGSSGERMKLIVAWVVVGVPAAWGVAQVVLKSMALFR